MNQGELFEALKEISIADHLDDSEMQTILDNGHYVELEKGSTIYSEGENVEKVFILLKGVVKITRNTEDNREVLKAILHPKTILDDFCIYDQCLHCSNASVMSPLVGIFYIDIKVINELVNHNLNLAKGIIYYMSRRLKDAEERLESFVLNDARERIIEFLKINAQSFGQAVGYEMLLKHNFTQQDIANYTGTSRQTVTMVLNDLKKTNKIHFKRQSILIRDLKALA
jgi:CRP/FNR family transcriptional regulator, cyclic AMP receptor protein